MSKDEAKIGLALLVHDLAKQSPNAEPDAAVLLSKAITEFGEEKVQEVEDTIELEDSTALKKGIDDLFEPVKDFITIRLERDATPEEITAFNTAMADSIERAKNLFVQPDLKELPGRVAHALETARDIYLMDLLPTQEAVKSMLDHPGQSQGQRR